MPFYNRPSHNTLKGRQLYLLLFDWTARKCVLANTLLNYKSSLILFYRRLKCTKGFGTIPIYVNVHMSSGDTANYWIDALQAAWSGVQVSLVTVKGLLKLENKFIISLMNLIPNRSKIKIKKYWKVILPTYQKKLNRTFSDCIAKFCKSCRQPEWLYRSCHPWI